MIYAVGGGIAGQSPAETKRIDRYDPVNDRWTVDAISLMATRRTHLGATLPTVYGRMFVFGGWDGYTELRNAEVYDPWTNRWSALPPMPTARYKAAYAAVGYKIYVIGGNWGGAGGHWLATNEELALPEPAQPENPIGFVRGPDWVYYFEIFTMNPDGSHQLRITNDGCANWHPTWTSDGKRILFSTDCNGNRDIYSMNPDGSDWRRLTTAPESDHRPSMSPNGRTIAFVRGSPPNEHIWLMNSDGTNLRQLTTGPGTEDDTSIAWSPDSQQIVFRSTRSGIWQLWRINVDGRGLTQLTSLPEEAHDPAWSPDGSTIAFSSLGELKLMSPDGSNVRTLPGPGWEARPAWAPDGTRLVYSSWRGGPSDLYSKRIDNSDERNLTNTPNGDDWDPQWAKPAGVGCVGGTTPLDVMLIIDRSGSMSGQPLADAKTAGKGFVDRMNLSQDQVGLASFGSDATLNRQLTHDGSAVKNAIDGLTSGGSTNMADGINVAQAELRSVRHNPAARPVIILMSDGVPDSSSAALSAAQSAKNAGTRIFTIGLGSVDANLMRQLASSASDYYYAPTSADLVAIYQTIAGVVTCSQARIKVSPASKRVPISGGAFTTDIVAEDVTNLGAYQVELTYSPAIVHVVSVAPGPFLGSTGRTVSPVGPAIDNNTGKVTFGAFTFGTQPGVNGTGVLATVTFQPKARGTSPLHLQNLQAADPGSSPIAGITTVDGRVEIVSCFGDFDGDNDVDIFDLQRAAAHWNCTAGQACYDVQFDTEPDGDIDVFDLQRFAAAWGTRCTTTQTLQSATSAAGSEALADVNLALIPATRRVTVGDIFTQTVRIQQAPALGGFQTDLVYDPALLEVEAVAIGPFLGSTGRSVTPLGPTINNVVGRVTFGAFTFGDQPGATGSGDLAYIRFRAKSMGQTTLAFQQTGVSDPQGSPVYLGELVGSVVSVGAPASHRLYLPAIIRER